MKVIGFLADPETTITATIPTTATSMTTGSSARIKGTRLGSGASGGASGRMSPALGLGPGIRGRRPGPDAPIVEPSAETPAVPVSPPAAVSTARSVIVVRECASPIVVIPPRMNQPFRLDATQSIGHPVGARPPNGGCGRTDTWRAMPARLGEPCP